MDGQWILKTVPVCEVVEWHNSVERVKKFKLALEVWLSSSLCTTINLSINIMHDGFLDKNNKLLKEIRGCLRD